MNITIRSSRVRGEQGMALIAVMLLLMLASGICAALAVSGRTETMASYNVDTSVQAHEAAQAGLTAAIQVILTHLNDNDGSISSLLAGPDNDLAADADNGDLAAYGLPAVGATAQLGSLNGVNYSTRVMDEEDAARGITWTSAMLTRIGENGTPADINDKIVIRAVGSGRGNTSVTLESIIHIPTMPGVITEGDLHIKGTVSIEGDQGGVHTNSNLDFNGSPDVEQDATATGTLSLSSASVGGISAGGVDRREIPPINAEDFLDATGRLTEATKIGLDTKRLNADGKGYLNGVLQCDAGAVATACASMGFTKTATGWRTNGSTASGAYYIEGDVDIDHTSITVSVFATGYIDLDANGTVTSAIPGLMFVTNEDYSMNGNSNAHGGGIFVREQISLGGNHEITGQIVVEGRTNTSNLGVTTNTFHGNVTITYDGGGYVIRHYAVGSWREVK